MDDFLFTIAEVSVAFAGFSGLVTVLAKRDAKSDRELDMVRLRDMLLLSLLAIAFALFPTLPQIFGADDETTWRVSAGVFALAWGGFGIQGFLAGIRLSNMGTRPFRGWLFWSNLVVHVAFIGLLIMVAADVPLLSGERRAIYATSLFALLYLAGAYFVALFVSLARARASL